MSITQPGTIPQEELLPNAGRSRSGRSTGTRCARKIGNTSVSRRVGRAHWRASSGQSDFQGLAVGTYGEISSNVRKMVSIAVEYGYKHLGASILASDLDAVKNSIRRPFPYNNRHGVLEGLCEHAPGADSVRWEGLCLQQSPEAVSPRGALGPGGLWFPGHVHT